MRPLSFISSALVMCAVCLLLSGCELSSTAGPTAETGLAIQGRVQGGQQAIVGAHVYLFAANTTGYGGAGIAASSSNASISLLTSGTGRALDSSGGATNGDYYVTSVTNGAFNISGDYTCTGGQQVYLYAVGGNPGLAGGTNNTGAGLLAALGTCPGSTGTTGNTFSSSLYVVMDEVSTIATAYALAGFATDAVHVSSSGSALAQTGIKNAFLNASNLETLSTGLALASTPSGIATVPQATIDTLANILGACVNTDGTVAGPTNPTACYTLFTNALSGGTTGTQPTDTATAAINIAHNPAANLAALYALSTATPPFAPALSAKPNDWTIALEFTGGGMNSSESVAIDSAGNAWVVGYDSSVVTEIPVTGTYVSGALGYQVGLSHPYTIAIDLSGNAWMTSAGTSVITEISSTGTAVSGSPFSGGGLNYPIGIATDRLGNAWIGNHFGDSVVGFSSAGGLLTGSGGYTGSGVIGPQGVAVDGSGSVWSSDNISFHASKFSVAGTLLGDYTGGGLNLPIDVALDSQGDAWFANYGGNSVTKLSNSGVAATGSPFTGGGMTVCYGIAVDGAGNVWVANFGSGGGLTELSNSGAVLSGALGYTGGVVNSATTAAIDGSGDVWTNSLLTPPTAVVELVGAAAPVITPLVAGLPATPTGNGSSNLGTRP